VLGSFAAVVAASLRNVNFATDDGFDATRFGCLVERLRSEQVAVIGYGHGGHLPPRSLVNNLFEVAGSIQQAVVRVQVQVNESGGFHAEGYSNRTRRFLLRHDSSDSGKKA